jgi:hypothetical protein
MPVQIVTVDRKSIADVVQCDLTSSDQQDIASPSQLVTVFHLCIVSLVRST